MDFEISSHDKLACRILSELPFHERFFVCVGRIFAAKDEWAPEYRQLGELCMLKATQWNPPAIKTGPRKVVVAGWCGEVEDLTASLTMFAPQGTDVTMVCECAPEVHLLSLKTQVFH